MYVAAWAQTISKSGTWPVVGVRQRSRGNEGLRGYGGGCVTGCYCTSWAEMRSSCRALCYFQLSPLPILPSHFPKHCFFTLCLPAWLPRLALQQRCLRPRSRRTTKWAVIRQLPALVVRPLDPHLCVFSPPIPQPLWSGLCPKPSIHASLACLLFFLSAWLSICFWWQCFLPERLVTLPAYQQPPSFLIFLVTPAPYAGSHMVSNLELF